MKLFFLFIFALFFVCSQAQTTAKTLAKSITETTELVKAQLDILEKDSDLKNASIGFIAIDIKSGENVAELNPDMSLVPASVQKVLTTATALELFGAGHRFKTTIEYTGNIDTEGVLHGNIYIRGGGDPTLGSKYFDNYWSSPDFMQTWVDSIKKAGIKSVKGKIVGDDSVFPLPVVPGSWMWSDIGNYFGASPCGLTIYDNTFEIIFSSGPNHGDSTWVDSVVPPMPGLILDNFVKASNESADNAYIYGAPFSNYRIATGTIPKGKDHFNVRASMPDPALYAATELQNRLVAAGVSCTAEPSTKRQMRLDKIIDTLPGKKLVVSSSPSLIQIINQTNMISYNLYAEHLLYLIGLKKYGSGEAFSGSKAIEAYWDSKGINTKGMYVNDGCGLSRMDVVTARQLAGVLKYMKSSGNSEAFFKSLPVAGKSGTMSSFGDGTTAEGRLVAKTGSMTRVRSYAGYVKTTSGKEIVFAFIVNNYNCSSGKMKTKMEKVLVTLSQK
ncbi:MAG: D-alanyl-D-alanine carboxypeptidase/D-alanyl-D-alanine-endopeptidase [Bacteroidetes bacterium GWF2_38_335]|nr:MAG: D-alanyl-D-alanine carboxypeptidase/D-alanyl-D-alanine-endopeptidase [Bacteroidetes bacterium GWF2_38_335]OFY78479.1 MAG: D-alanyl-D-alanine carboxypeptidase/D-alanyl-D-alanine-endopeptidase [Bacteroidetes bacterium RIFOXYA12_FULL_38_20]HBS88428.1 D-alanyl-D-alanine carboxypeptidase/D-alanyl-D-alanine-endopeptidase [Bacteroidales bacterium]